MKTISKPTGTALYRYDVSQPPSCFSVNHKNPEYYSGTKGNKNMFGGFFFFCTEAQALNTGKMALSRYKDGRYDKLWITTCKTTENTLLLDFTGYISITAILTDFMQSGIDVFTDSFHEYFTPQKKSFFNLREPVAHFCEIIQDDEWYKNNDKFVSSFVKLVETYFIDNSCPGVLGQCLTDFDNGLAFRNILMENNWEGYVFNESDGRQETDTLCFLDCAKLSSPECCEL